jgi:hypothetical protein
MDLKRLLNAAWIKNRWVKLSACIPWDDSPMPIIKASTRVLDVLRKRVDWLSVPLLSNIDLNSAMKKLSHKFSKTRIYNTFAA